MSEMVTLESSVPQTKPTLSVILCVNRVNPWLTQALDSVLDQDDSDFEFLISANACGDDLWVLLSAYALRDQRIRLYRTAIGQLAFNLNLLANLALGEYLVRMDADDVCEPHRLRSLRLALAEQSIDVLGSSVTLIDGDNNVVGQMTYPTTDSEIKHALLTRSVFCHPAVAIRREFLLQARGYLGGFVSEDTDLWLRAKRLNARMHNLPDSLLRYRVHNEQSTASRAGYAEVASHWLRELFLVSSWYNLRGFFIALLKALFAKRMLGLERYKIR